MVLDKEIIDESIPDTTEAIDNPGACYVTAASLPAHILAEQIEIEEQQTLHDKLLQAVTLWRCRDCRIFLFSEEECDNCTDDYHNVEKLNHRKSHTIIPDFRNYQHWSCYTCNRFYYSLDSAASCYANNHEIEQIEKLPVLKPYIPSDSILEDGIDYDVIEDDFTQNYMRYVDAIRAGEWSAVDYPKPWTLPGMSVSRESCGNWFTKGCLGPVTMLQTHATQMQTAAHKNQTVGVMKKHLMTCKMHSCHTCFEYTIALQAKQIQERLEAHVVRLDSELNDDRVLRIFNHFIVSFNRSEIELLKDADYMKKTIKKIDGYMTQLGIEGGVRILHCWRFTKNLATPYWSPHLHFICTGYTKAADIIALNESTGHVFHHVKKEDKNGNTIPFTDGKGVFNLARYLLSHSAVAYKKHSYVFTGEAHNRKFKTATILNNASSCKDDLDNHLTDIEAGSLLPKGFTSCKIVKLQAQIFQCGSEFIAKGYLKGDVKTYTDERVMKQFADDVKEHIEMGHKDNPAKAKSDTETADSEQIVPSITHTDYSFIVMKILFTANKINKHGIIEECEEDRYHILRLDPNISGLCRYVTLNAYYHSERARKNSRISRGRGLYYR